MCAKRNILISFLIMLAKEIFEITKTLFLFLIMLAKEIFEIIRILFLNLDNARGNFFEIIKTSFLILITKMSFSFLMLKKKKFSIKRYISIIKKIAFLINE